MSRASSKIASPGATPAAGPPVPDHELLRVIGRGAYGEVWLARHNTLGTLRAVKVVRRADFDDERPFRREFEGIRRYEPISRSHPNLVAILHVGGDDAVFFYMMELADAAEPGGSDQCSVVSDQSPTPAVPAPLRSSLNTDPLITDHYSPRTLRAELKSRGHAGADETIALGCGLAGALAHLHAHGLVHRDVKPSNVIFAGGVPKLADIGLVTAVGDSRSFVGTEGYIPPEGPGAASADCYALGKLLYEFATGRDRHDWPAPAADLATRPDRARLLELNAILHRACAPKPGDRYANGAAMQADLERLRIGQSVKRRHSLQRGWTRTWKMAVVLALLGLGALLIRNERDRRAALTRLNASPFEKSGTTNYAAWQARERSRVMGSTFAATGFSNAILELERAVALDPNYAAAWTSLAGSLFLSVEKGYISGAKVIPRALACAEQATKLDPSNGWAWHWAGQCSLALDYDFVRAEPLLLKAVRLAPDAWQFRHNLACLLWYYGRFEEAEANFRQVIREQPASGFSEGQLGLVHASRGHFADALSSLGEWIQLQPALPMGYMQRGEILWALDRREEAARDWLRSVELDGFSSLTLEDAALLNTTLKQTGPDGFLRGLIGVLERRQAEGRFVSAYDLARLHVFAGNKTRALDHLELAVDEHSAYTLNAKVHLAFRDFQDEPRYHAVLRRLKLEK